jgi:hypothetical protein
MARKVECPKSGKERKGKEVYGITQTIRAQKGLFCKTELAKRINANN